MENIDQNKENSLFEKELIIQQIDDKIHQLYHNVIKKFHQCEYSIYNPDILSKLNEDKFYQWIINNNNNISNLLFHCERERMIHGKEELQR